LLTIPRKCLHFRITMRWFWQQLHTLVTRPHHYSP
jgi:hypothetical protein